MMLKFVNDRASEARIGSTVNTTRPMSHGDRNRRPQSVSRRARLPLRGVGTNDRSRSSTITIDPLRNRVGWLGRPAALGRPRLVRGWIGWLWRRVEVGLQRGDHVGDRLVQGQSLLGRQGREDLA